MKKIILVLMMISSFALAVSDSYSYNGKTYYLTSSNSRGQDYWIDLLPQIFSTGENTIIVVSLEGASSVSDWQNYCSSACSVGTNTISYYDSTVTPECTSTQERINGTCVEKCPAGQERLDGVCVNSCNQMLGEFRKSDGTCQDCSSYTNFSSRSFCACDSQGSTYTPQPLATYNYSTGNYSYKMTHITCDNGTRVTMYTDPVNLKPNDYNSTLNPDGTTTPVPPTPDNNSSGTGTGTGGTGGGTGGTGTGGTITPAEPTTPTTNDVVEAVKAVNDSTKKSIEELKNNNKSINDFKDKFDKFVTSDKANASAQLSAISDLKTAVSGTTNAVNGTTNAVNNQGKNITDKLDEVIKAIKDGDGNGTSSTDGNNSGKDVDLNATNKKLDTLHDDNNKTHSKLDTLHDDANKTNSTLSDIKGLLDFNASKYTIDNMLPEGGEGWFTSKALNLNFNISGDCYCQTAQFEVGGRTFVFPPQELLDMIPFDVISRMLMAFIYVLGLRNFLKS